ncbi:hypothetical protein C5S29_08950 [ANME-1 cluster archaeon GoMg3.2]|nr:hypothetical protein [ANME-1 cluster archaeon GoMg3.2]
MEKREHPIKAATFLHHKLVEIHPFADGNGRVARLLTNLYLMKDGYPPIVLRKEERGKYYHFLRIADEGNLGPFANFIAKSVDESLTLYLAIERKWYSSRRALRDYIREHAKINLFKSLYTTIKE